jgi:hypothetical protein
MPTSDFRIMRRIFLIFCGCYPTKYSCILLLLVAFLKCHRYQQHPFGIGSIFRYIWQPGILYYFVQYFLSTHVCPFAPHLPPPRWWWVLTQSLYRDCLRRLSFSMRTGSTIMSLFISGFLRSSTVCRCHFWQDMWLCLAGSEMSSLISTKGW